VFPLQVVALSTANDLVKLQYVVSHADQVNGVGPWLRFVDMQRDEDQTLPRLVPDFAVGRCRIRLWLIHNAPFKD
jgi:hypothetical protein